MQQQRLVYFDEDYLSRSWRMLTRVPGWSKPVILLSLAALVPIFGPLALLGYTLEWARLTAWGIDSSPKQAGVDIWTCIAVGWRAFLVSVCWALPYALVVGILRSLGGNGVVGDVLSFLITLLGVFVSIVITVACLRATIYQQFTAGLGLGRIIEMVETDPKGLLRIAGISLFASVVIMVVSGIIMTVGSMASLAPLIDVIGDLAYAETPAELGKAFGAIFAALGPTFAITAIVTTYIGTLFSLIITNAVGLWMLQFDVPAWGDKDAPLPTRIPPAPRFWNAPTSPVVPAAPLLPDQNIYPEQPQDPQDPPVA